MPSHDSRPALISTVGSHRIGVLSVAGWCEGTISRDSNAYGARLFDKLRRTLIEGVYLRDATVDRFDCLSEMRIAGAYIEAIVDFGDPPVANLSLLQPRSLLPMQAVTASGAVVRGDLVVPMHSTELPEVRGDPSFDLRIVCEASIEIAGRRIVENATLLLDLRRVAFYGRTGDLPTWPAAQRAADERFELVTEIA